MEISAHSHEIPAQEIRPQGGRLLEEDFFDRFVPGVMVAGYLCTVALAILAGIY